MSKALTEKQEQTLDYIAKYIDENGKAPLRRELAEHFNISIKAACDRLELMEFRGLIKLGYYKMRDIRIVKDLKDVR